MADMDEAHGNPMEDRRKAREAFEAWKASLSGLSRLEVGRRVAGVPDEVRSGSVAGPDLDKYKVFEVEENGDEPRYLYAHWNLDEARVLARMHRDLTNNETVVKTHPREQRPRGREKPVKAPGKFQIMPDLAPEECAALKEEIRRDGIRAPIMIDGTNHILDGHNRLRIWRELINEGVDMAPLPLDVRTDLKTDKEKRDKAIALNMARRHLTREQKRVVVENILRATPEKSNRQIAELTGVDHKTVGKYRDDLGSTGEIPQLKKTTGADGKARAVKRPKPAPAPDPDAIPADVADAYYPVVVGADEADNGDGTSPATLTDEERELYDRLTNGEIIVVNMHKDGPHKNLVAWLRHEGLLVRVDRTTDWGNPFKIPGDGDRDTVVHNFEHHYLAHKPSLIKQLDELRGKALGCWCAPELCHADVLLRLAEEEEDRSA